MIPNHPRLTDLGNVSVVSFTPGTATDFNTGLIGWLKLAIGELIVDGITVRRTTTGRLTLSFPAKTDHAGRRHAYLRPADDRARRDLEAKVFAQLHLDLEGRR